MTNLNDDKPFNFWSADLEIVLESIRSNAGVMSEYHKKNYISLKSTLKYFKIPVIIVSGFNSVIAVGLQPYMSQGIISASNCLLALLVGIIGSIELFLGISNSMELELIASKNFYLLAVDIYKTLTLDRSNRSVNGREFLDEKYSDYIKLIENAEVITSKLKDKLVLLPLPHDKSIFSNFPSKSNASSEKTIEKIKQTIVDQIALSETEDELSTTTNDEQI